MSLHLLYVRLLVLQLLVPLETPVRFDFPLRPPLPSPFILFHPTPLSHFRQPRSRKDERKFHPKSATAVPLKQQE